MQKNNLRRLLLSSFLLMLTTVAAFAYTDSFAYLKEDADYNILIDAIKNGDEEAVVEEAYERFLLSNPKEVDTARIQYHLVRYYTDLGSRKKAAEHLAFGYSLIGDLKDKLCHDLAKAEMVSADYYLNGKTSVGMESSGLTKDLYKDFPDEVAVFLMEANRTLYSPHIAGGSPKRAIEYFHKLENSGLELQNVDLFSLFAGLGVGYEKRGKDKEAKDYLIKAVTLYKGDQSLWKILSSSYGITKESI
jgi:hypothetical protein